MRSLLLLVALVLPLVGCSTPSTTPRPNVVLILADDLGYGDLGAYGQVKIKTPELDALAAEGVRFTRFYSGSPHCAPARSCLLEGRDSGHASVRQRPPFPPGVRTFPQDLQAAGYRTGMFGKWGMATHDGTRVTAGDPVDAGFDAFLGSLTHRDAQAAYLDHPADGIGTPMQPPQAGIHQTLWTIRDGITSPHPIAPDQYVHDACMDAAMDFIQSAAGEPFFLYLPMTPPHAELAAPDDELLAQYLDASGRSIFPETPWTPTEGRYLRHNMMPRATYAAMVSRISRDVGRVIDVLHELGVADETIVIFTSDNGPHSAGGMQGPAFFDSTAGLRDMKWQLTEGGVRVPGVIWGPGYFEGGRVTEAPSAAWDLAATICDYASTSPPPGGQGASLRPLLERNIAPDRAVLYWETFNGPGRYRQAVLMGRYKALRVRGKTPGDHVELYDLAQDPGETVDLSGDPRLELVKTMMIEIMNESREPPLVDPEGRFELVPLDPDAASVTRSRSDHPPGFGKVE